jgi:hypothetical protein
LVNGASFDNSSGGYVELDGVNQFVGSIGTVANFAFVQTTGTFFLGAWVKFAATTGRQIIMGNNPNAGNAVGFYMGLETVNFGGAVGNVTKRLNFILRTGTANVFIMSQDNIITDTDWHYVALSRDSSGAQWYVDGIPVPTSVSGTFPTTSANSTNTLSVGHSTGSTLYMNGRIGPVHINSIRLTNAQVASNYAALQSRYP